jgi:hypothetical protein
MSAPDRRRSNRQPRSSHRQVCGLLPRIVRHCLPLLPPTLPALLSRRSSSCRPSWLPRRGSETRRSGRQRGWGPRRRQSFKSCAACSAGGWAGGQVGGWGMLAGDWSHREQPLWLAAQSMCDAFQPCKAVHSPSHAMMPLPACLPAAPPC